MLVWDFTQAHVGVDLYISIYTSECYQLAERFWVTQSRLTCKKKTKEEKKKTKKKKKEKNKEGNV